MARAIGAARARLCADPPHTARAIGSARVSLNQPCAPIIDHAHNHQERMRSDVEPHTPTRTRQPVTEPFSRIAIEGQQRDPALGRAVSNAPGQRPATQAKDAEEEMSAVGNVKGTVGDADPYVAMRQLAELGDDASDEALAAVARPLKVADRARPY